MNGVTLDYTGRTVDLEALQTMQNPYGGRVELSKTASAGASRRVTGVQKAVQRYVTLLLTTSSSVPFPADERNILYEELKAGRVSDEGYLRHLFNMANAAALDTMRADDYNIDKFGDQADDERIAEVVLKGITLDYGTSTLGLSLEIRTEAGSEYAYTVPVSTRQE